MNDRATVRATCMAAVIKDEEMIVLLKFEPRNNNIIGEIAREIFEFEQGETYSITIKKEGK